MVTTSAGRKLKFWGAGRDPSNAELARKGKRIKGLSFLYWLIITRPAEGAGRSDLYPATAAMLTGAHSYHGQSHYGSISLNELKSNRARRIPNRIGFRPAEHCRVQSRRSMASPQVESRNLVLSPPVFEELLNLESALKVRAWTPLTQTLSFRNRLLQS